MNIELGRRASQARNTVLAGTSTALDVLYEITGRRVKALQRGAALLYDMSCEGVNLDVVAPAEAAPVEAAPAPAAATAAPEAAPAPLAAAEAAPELEPAPEPEPVEPNAPDAAPALALEAAPAAEAPVEAPPEEPGAARVAPVEGYDDLTVKQALEALEGLGLDALREVLAYEEQTRARVTLIRAIKKRLDA